MASKYKKGDIIREETKSHIQMFTSEEFREDVCNELGTNVENLKIVLRKNGRPIQSNGTGDKIIKALSKIKSKANRNLKKAIKTAERA